ncbi:18133_t:CDS:1 [Racocetra fulgida]|uniref:18133_t:CDS:1 n=1 Tax=Racocetra fulgida TaxID=60492 RepID=A0A9N9A3A0_9GLOM|nr:18133_t:CDS:1 [Racocetra fulgida]
MMIVVAAIIGLFLIFVILYRQRRNRSRISDPRLKPLQLVQDEPLLKQGKHGNDKNNKKNNRHSLPATKSTAATEVRKYEVRLSMPIELAKPMKDYYQIESRA